MRTFTLHKKTLVHKPLNEVFRFFSDAANLQKLTPSWLHFEIKTPKPIHIQKGSLIDYQIRIHGIPIRWQTEITEWEPPYRFVDVQKRGPYRLWIHEHTFKETTEGIKVLDDVQYAPPLGIVTSFFVKRDLKKIFEYREKALTEYFSNQI